MAIYLTHLGSGVSLCRLSLRDSLLCVPTAAAHVSSAHRPANLLLVAKSCRANAQWAGDECFQGINVLFQNESRKASQE